ncbi:MAG: AAA family ATPase [Victivallaceae bacterium]|nr:AAA family ATPase [Victivallaceae bacterium]
MEITSIKEIKNVGTFANFANGGSIRFDKLTFIYGLNTFGKTTIADIFQSIKDNNSSISNRKTIPFLSQSQKINISVKENNSEQSLIFQNDNWQNNKISKYLEIFGSEFIHRNLFTGLSIERENKENFTQFVLGEKGVELANDIESNKKKLADKRRNLINKVPVFVKNNTENEINKFVSFPTDNLNIEDIKTQINNLTRIVSDEKKKLEEPDKILNLPDVQKFTTPEINILANIEKVNQLLQNDYQDIKDEVLRKLEKHISENFKETDEAEKWIEFGNNNRKTNQSENCSFCGQSLLNAKELMGAYDLYFDEEYSKFITAIEENLEKYKRKYEFQKFNNKNVLQNALTQSLKYKSYITNETFQTQLQILEEKINLLDEDLLFQQKEQLAETIKNKSTQKNKKPYQKVDLVEFNEFKTQINSYLNVSNSASQIIDNIVQIVEDFKQKYKDTKGIKVQIEKYEIQIRGLQYKAARLEQDESCKTYLSEKTLIKKIEKNVSELESDLEKNQTGYLTTYFSKINSLFNKLGSKNFTLKKATEGRGYKPVYSLKVKFHNKELNDNQLKTVFSESDRRALALAIFWAKIELKDENEKTKTIIILDDPITSFDDNRISSSITLFKNSLDSLSQIIVLTHYPNFIKIFCEKTLDSEIKTKFIKIERDNKTSLLKNEIRETFTNSPYEVVFSKIMGFINREHQDCIKSDLRPFIENLYIPTVFAKELKEAKKRNDDLSSLNNIINAIFTDEQTKSKFHNYRNSLNPDAHIFTSNNSEDVRNFADELMTFLYSFDFNLNGVNYEQ